MTTQMQLHLTSESRISDIQQQFNSWFPYLKIQFSSQHIYAGATQVKRTLLPQDTILGQIAHVKLPFEFQIEGTMTVADLESYIEDKTGLYVQVFRSSGSLWLITTATDQWTLNKQNSEGEELSKKTDDKDDPVDIHEQE